MKKRIRLLLAKYLLRFIAELDYLDSLDLGDLFFKTLSGLMTPEEERELILDFEFSDAHDYIDNVIHFPFLGHFISIQNIEYGNEDELGGYWSADYYRATKRKNDPIKYQITETLHGLYEEPLNDALKSITETFE